MRVELFVILVGLLTMAQADFLHPPPGPKCPTELESITLSESTRCRIEANYSFFVIEAPPTSADAVRVCGSDNCKKLVADMQRVAPTECVMHDGFYLYADILKPVLAQCAIPPSRGSDTSSSTSTTETTKSDGGSSTIIVVVVVVGVAIVGGALFVFWWRPRQRRLRDKGRHYNLEEQNNDRTPDTRHVFKSEPQTSMTQWTKSTEQTSASTAPIRSTTNSFTGPRAVEAASVPLFQDEMILQARIPYDEVETTSFIDNGAYGSVYKGSFQGHIVAIKKLRASHASDVLFITKFMEEVKLLVSLSHPRIVTFVGVAWTKPEDVCAVMEFMEGGDLLSLLQRFDQDPSKSMGFDSLKLTIALHIAEALTYLHSRWPVILHRDLKSNNILLSTDYDAKVTDFGVSRAQADEKMTMKVGTQRWMAPEVINGQDYDDKADVFSFGVVLSELDTNKIPYATHEISGMPPLAMMQAIARGQLTVEFSYASDPRIVALGRECVSIDPRKRPSMDGARRRIEGILRGDGGIV